MDQQINEVCNERDENKKLLEGAKHELDEQVKIRDEKRRVIQESEARVVEANIEALIETLNDSKQVREQKQLTLQQMNEDLKLAESEVEERKKTKLEVAENLSSTEKAVEQMKAHNKIFEKRVESDKTFVVEIIQSKLKRQEDDLEKANLNVAGVLRDQLERFNANEVLVNDLEFEQQEKLKIIEELNKIKLEKEQSKQSLEDQLNNVQTDDTQLQQKKVELKEKLNEGKAKKAAIIREHNNRVSYYERKIKKETRKQSLLGFVDDEQASTNKSAEEEPSLETSNKSSDDSGSQISSSIAELLGMAPLEKMNFDTSIVSSIYDSTIQKKNI